MINPHPQKKKGSSELCHILNGSFKKKHDKQHLGRNSRYWKSDGWESQKENIEEAERGERNLGWQRN